MGLQDMFRPVDSVSADKVCGVEDEAKRYSQHLRTKSRGTLRPLAVSCRH